ncbi:MAG: holo-ACP synthase [Nitriliruptorales bacterium]|nr:holo-ACP synthase [Nitriliruptorales bacterium]
MIGIGVDAIEIGRVERALRRTPTLQARLYTERERAACASRCGEPKMGGLAARFAAKEAVAKAFGTGVKGFAFRDIEVLNERTGRPAIHLSGGAAALAKKLGVDRIHLSLSTSDSLAIANVILESADSPPPHPPEGPA